MNDQRPPNIPDKKNRDLGRKEEGNIFWNKQTEDQLVPIAIVINVVVRKSRLIKDGNAVAGLLLETTKGKYCL
jgi:hypothetical protein